MDSHLTFDIFIFPPFVGFERTFGYFFFSYIFSAYFRVGHELLFFPD